MKTSDHKARWKAAQFAALESLRDTRCTLTGDQIYCKLRIIEGRASRYATDDCNGDPVPEEWQEQIAEKVRAVFMRLPDGFFVNGDPRGYALKLDNDKVKIPEGMQTDWGGYGLLAPTF